MKSAFRSRTRRNAQTLVFFLIAWGTIMLLAGLAIDSGLLYLAKARMSRAVDGAALAAVGNFNRNPDPATNRDDVAIIMRNFAAANFTELNSISTTASPHGGTANQTTLPNGTTTTSYTYNFNDGTQDANGQYRRFVQVILNTGSGGNITSAVCNSRCPVQTYFIGYATYAIGGRQNVKIGGYSGPSGLVDLKVSSSAVATRNPRLIMVVIDRSASMLESGGGASGLPPAIVQFLDFFDTSSDNIGIVSFGSSARLEMPLTTNFLIAGTNNLVDAYETDPSTGTNQPGIDPEQSSTDSRYDPNYNKSGVRRLKFGGQTAADDGIRLGIEEMMANSGFNDPDVVKYLVIFTDGKWNASRSLFAAPGYTNVVSMPNFTAAQLATNKFVTNLVAQTKFTFNGQEYYTNAGVKVYGPWNAGVTTDMTPNSNLMLMPTLSPMQNATNAMAQALPGSYDFTDLVSDHTNDVWLSSDGTVNEPLGAAKGTKVIGGNTIQGTTQSSSRLITTTPFLSTDGVNNYYTRNLDVWLQPGAVDYLYHLNGSVSSISNSGAAVYVSDYTNPDKHININLANGDSNVLVVPGYIADGVVYDGLDLGYFDNPTVQTTTNPDYTSYRLDNFQQPFMWPDDTGGGDTAVDTYLHNNGGTFATASLQRQLMFRNYANLLTGYYLFKPDEPTNSGVEPLITEFASGAPRSRYGLGAYYPSAGFYWPFGGETVDSKGYITNAVGLDYDPTFGLLNPTVDNGSPFSRHIAYSLNMLSTNAAPEWYGELFYKSVSGGGTNTISGNSATSASSIMHSADWKVGASGIPYLSALMNISGLTIDEATHDTNITGSPSVWRPVAYNGSPFSPVTTNSSVTPSGSSTGGWVYDGNGHYYPNAMAWSGRPTHYFDFSKSSWEPIPDNHKKNNLFLQIGNWKAWEYCWHARALGVTIYTVGYGTHVLPDQQVFLAQLANATNTTAGGGTNISFNPNQPIGQQFFATNSIQISNDFYLVGQAINAALTQ